MIGCGVKSSTSDLLIAGCDEFIYYDDLVRAAKPARTTKRKGKQKSDKREQAIDQLLEIIRSLEREYDPLWGSLIKQTIRRVHPGFNESYYGFRTFSSLLEDMAERGLLSLEHDEERGNYKVKLASE